MKYDVFFYVAITLLITWSIYHVISAKRNSKKNILLVYLKPLVVLVSFLLLFSVVHNLTITNNLSNEEIAKDVFSTNSNSDLIKTYNYFNYKLFLYENKDSLQLKTAKETFRNSYTNKFSSQINIKEDNPGYSIMILDNNESKGLVVYGRNSDAKLIEIIFNGKKYAEPLNENTYFLVTFPTFEVLNDDNDLINVYQSEPSQDFSICFIEENGDICTHMKYIK